MKMKWLIVTAMIASIAMPSYSALAQWDEDEEQQRLEDQQREDVLYQGSEVGTHDDSIKKPKKRWHQPPPQPTPGKTMTPDQEIEGTSEYQK